MNRLLLQALALSILYLLKIVGAYASCQPSVGKFVSIEGSIEIKHIDQEEWKRAELDIPLCRNDTIHVGENSRTAISLINDVVLRLDQNTAMQLTDVVPEPEKRSILDLITGAFKSFSRPPRFLSVNTPYVNGLIEGTEFAMRIDGESTVVTVFEGKVNTQNDKGQLLLTRGQSAVAKAGKAPEPFLLVKPWNAVQWTLYFPPLLASFAVEGGNYSADFNAIIKDALALASKGDTPSALSLLNKVSSAQRDANFHLYRAALFLNVGRVEQAQADIETALRLDPKAGLAYALRSIIEVVNNEQQQALADAEKGVTFSPSSATKIALSYAQQAAFRLEAARDTLLSAVKEHPDDPLAWARLGELWLMFGEREKALEAARKAGSLAPGLVRTQDVLGFAALAENHVSEAKTAFEKGIELNSADPLAHFGLGLAKIKVGDLKEGRRDIEAAVALDSSSAILRSYLGKAYYEEKRFPLEGHQYSIAKELDPSDPTPYLYDAIDKQTTNRPVEALHDMQKAIELNDNRAVYRSRQLLDSDLAVRSASLARVYTDLGFQELALREGWKSVAADPSNFSAHRFLADSYAILPRHEIARVSELLRSQLLQPLNMTPIQPRLAESNLFLISAGGPGSTSFNEFNPIFNRDGLTYQASGLIGENDTYMGEGIVSGIFDKMAFSFGGFHSSSNGFRANDDFQDDIANTFVQYEISPQTSVQAEYRYRNTDKGDLLRRFFLDNYSFGERNKIERHSYRVGVRHNLSESSTLLGSFIYQTAKLNLRDNIIPGLPPDFLDLTLNRPEDSAGFEIQHLFSSEYINLTTGVGHTSISGSLNSQQVFAPPLDFLNSANSVDLELSHTNAYLYSYLRPLHHLILTVGVSGDFTDGSSPDVAGINQINPKFGISWQPWGGTTFRAAAFRSLKRTLINNQTIEPTQIAGFNQFYDDLNGTKAWRYGAGIDQKFSKAVYGGVEISRRDLRSPAVVTNSADGTTALTRSDWREDLARAYFFWTPQPWLSLRAEYQYEHLKRDPGDNTDLVFGRTLGVEKMDTQRVPLGVSVFLPSGWSTSVTTTYYNQHGLFDRLDGQNSVAGQDNFWLVDTALSYRLPKRYGFISVGATNIFDERFQFFDTDFNNPRVHDGRMIFGRVTLALP